MGPTALAQVLRPLSGLFPAEDTPNLLRGLAVPDDAAVWKLDDERALVLTADFFPPVVDDPGDYGRIAAANALSDVFAMGADPLFGINLVGFPKDLDPGILTEILAGGAEKVKESGAVIAGGHTVTDHEPKYGLAVVGMVHPDRLWSNEGVRAGDVAFLTKPLGTGLVATAIKKGAPPAALVAEAVASMARLNRGAMQALRSLGDAVHAVTDITGFGLGGHLHEMAAPSGVKLSVAFSSLPILDGARALFDEGFTTGGARRNREYFEAHAAFPADAGEWERSLIYDPQTSGGLLAAIDPAAEGTVQEAFARAGEPLWKLGTFETSTSITLQIR